MHNLIVISFLVFIFLNLIENLIHYNIGILRNKKLDNPLVLPTNIDWIRIITSMVFFACLQGFFVYLFYSKM